MSIIPKLFPAFPEREEFDVYALLKTAKAVGGDLYDFIQIPDDPDNLAVVIADVTGKGVPAALFMAFGRTAIRAEVMNGRQPADTLRRTNRMILLDTQSPLLMSAFLASFNLKSGTMTYACAGHDRPLWVSAKENDVSIIDGKGIVLGVFEGVTIEENAIEIDSGDFVIFYTDGVTEAQNAQDALF